MESHRRTTRTLSSRDSIGSLPSETLENPVSWRSLPRKGQLAIIVFARLAEPLSERSFASYLFYQLRWFDPALSDSEIAYHAGLLTALFAAAQCITAIWWGHVADNPLFGRKRVLLLGLLGTSMSALGMGFSTSFTAAVVFRLLAGALNGNVGVLRTMISEMIVDKRYQSRAFLLLPMCFNVGVIIGPLLGGLLAEPATAYPNIFGPGSVLGGHDGVWWMVRYPYALPNIVCAALLTTSAIIVVLGLEETHPLRRDRRDYGRQLGLYLGSRLFGDKTSDYTYMPIDQSAEPGGVISPINPEEELDSESLKPVEGSRARLRALCTRNVALTFLQHHLQALHVSCFNTILFIVLPAPRSKNENAHLPFRFTGGLGLSAQGVGYANTVIGFVGIPLQILLYPPLSARMGVLSSYRIFLPLSGLVYCLLPFLVLAPDKAAVVWPCLISILSAHVFSRVFIAPSTIILINESAPHPTLLGTVHGVAQSISSAARMLGPTLGAGLLGWGLNNNCVGAPFWTITIIALLNWTLLWWVKSSQHSKTGSR